MKTFVKNVTRSLLEFNTSFAFAQYSSGTTIHVNFHQFQRTGWENQVDSISQRGGGTRTAGAIQTVVDALFDSSAGARPDAVRILIVLTDGQSGDASSYPSVTAQADSKNITRYAIGIGSAFSSQSAQDELRSIASSPESDFVFRVDNFEALDNISSRLEKSIMVIEGVVPTTCSPPTPEPPIPTSQGDSCSSSATELSNRTSQAAADIVFLLDGSGSVAAHQFLVMKTFVKNVTRSLLEFNTSFAFAQYSSGTTIHVNFHQFQRTGWENQVDSISQRGGGTRTAGAIQTVVDTLFDSSAGARPDAVRILIVLTDGQSGDASSYPSVTAQADSKNITRYAIGIGSAFSSQSAQDELRSIASSPESDFVFRVDNFEALDNISSRLEKSIMVIEGVVPTTCSPPTPEPPIPTSQGDSCSSSATELSNRTSQAAADIVFLLDGSGSVAAHQFLVMKTFVKNVTRSLLEFNTSFAFAQYSSGTTIHVNFHQFQRTGWENQVDSISQRGGGTRTAGAIQTVVDTLFDSSAGARPDAVRILIVLTDGQSGDASSYPSVTAQADSKNITRYAIGIGSAFSSQSAQDELRSIASSPESDFVFRVDNFEALDNISSRLEKSIMVIEGVVPTTCSPPTPEPPIPTSQGDSCSSSATELSNRTSQAAADIVFLLDGSGSVAAHQFLVMKTFVKNVTRSLLEFNTSFAFAQYSSGTTIHVNFHQFQRTGWENQVDSISQRGGGTRTAGAIQTVVDTLFDSSAGARPDAVRILIVLTDGQSGDASSYPSVTAQADSKNITRYAIGIGSAFSSQSAQDELRSIASSPESDFVFRVDNFEALDNISSRLEKSIMVIEGVVPTTCSPPTPEPPIPTSQGDSCSSSATELSNRTSQAAADIVFLLDGSGSVAAHQFLVMKTFVKNVTRSLLEFNTSFAFAQYSSGTTIHVNFHQFQRTGWENQVDSISQRGGGTRTAGAIQTVVDTLFDSSAGARPDAVRILIVLTDGQSGDASSYPSVTAQADSKNITRYAIGIGSAFSSQSAQDELRSIASSPESDFVFRVDNFEALDNISSRLEKSIMVIEGVVPTTCSPPTPEPPIPTSQGDSCSSSATELSNRTSQAAADIVFLLDGSGSVAAHQFLVMKTFVKNVTRSLLEFNTSFAFAQYSSGTTIHVNFHQFQRTGWENQVDSISQRGGGTRTAGAIQTVVDTLFDSSAGARPDAVRILIVLTDGQSGDASSYPSVTAQADSKNITRYAIGIGSAFSSQSAQDELRSIASSPESDFVFRVDNFEALDNISSRLEKSIMVIEGVVPTTCSPPTPEPPIPTSQGDSCSSSATELSNRTSQAAADIVFLLDGSGSVAAHQFLVMKTFVKNVTRSLLEFNTSFAFAQYSSGTTIHVNFHQFQRTGWENQVDSISQRGGGTRTAGAIQTVVDTLFDSSAGARPDAVRILIVLTDGQSGDASSYPSVTAQADSKNITRYAIGIGSAFSSQSAQDELRSIASSPESDFVFRVDNFEALDNISSRLEKSIMVIEGVVPTTCSPPTPEPPIPTSQGDSCSSSATELSNRTSQAAADIVFLLDGSGSVAAHQFLVMKTFVKNVTRSLLEFNTSFAFAQYSSGTTIHVNFHQFQRTGWENQVDSISQRGGGTRTAGAIQTVVDTLFDSSAGARPDAVRILIVLTDGQSGDASSYPSVTAQADSKNITRYAIGIGSAFSSQSAQDELRSIASSPESDFVFRVDNFEALDNISSRLEKSIMVIEGVVPTTCSPPTPEPPIPTSQGDSCSSSATELSNRTSQAAADIVFLLDGSGSVAAHQFLVMKTFVKNVTRSLLEFNTSFAFAQYSSGTTIHVNFHQFQRTGWENQVDSISQRGGGTRTAGAIQTVVDTLFDSSAGARPDAVRILIVLTDGQSGDASSYPSVTAQADSKNITRYAIGIGSAFTSQSAQDELRSIASSPESDFVFRVDNFEALDNISSRLEKSIMVIEGVVPTTCSPPTPEPPIPTSQGDSCSSSATELSNRTSQAAADIVFLLDGSGSVAAHQFLVMKTFVKNVTRSLLEFNTSFAFAQYSSGTTVHVNFHQFQRTGWENQVDSISQRGGGTRTAGAIQTVVDTLFDSSAGSRPDAVRILIVLTDGQSGDASSYPSVTAQADSKNITRYAIGIGSAFSSQSAQDELRSIASSPESDFVFRVDNFEALDNISSRLEKSIMVIEGVVPTTCSPPTPEPPIPTSQGDSCSSSATELSNRTSQAAADIVFLLDGSGSVAAHQFLVMKTFVKNVTRSLLEFNTSFAFAQYSSGTTIHVNFHQFQRTGWENQVDSISQRGGGTRTAGAIQTVVDTLFDSSAGARPDAVRILIVLTDGQSGDASSYPSVTAQADSKNITRYAIGIGSAFSSQSAQDELRSIASSPESDFVFRVDNFEALDNISSRLEKSIMVIEGVVPTTCSPPTPEPPIPTSQAAADIVFLLDGSGSVAANQFLVMKTFVKNVTRSLLEFNTSFAFAQYSSGTTIHVNFHQFQRTGWENQVDTISQRGGGTRTAGAIQTVV
ncbi:uncharacterized protein LOC134075948 [Sardina pilchardus]|uniref:uncharacterized protein LOC134075948 n=1 Tax=Sardina pilchardus TaxID=27697 RepID=UPI002E0F1A4A